MPEALIEAGTLTASLTERTVSGLLLPFGEIGNTNLGKFSIDKGIISIPRDHSVVGANTDHNREFPVGRATTLSETDAGIVGTFSIANTDEGDVLLGEIADGTRSKLSAEVRNIVLRAGKAVSGTLFGAAFVPVGAFPSASLLAADVGDLADVTDEDLERQFTPAEIKALRGLLNPETSADDTADEATTTPTPNTESEADVAAIIPNTLTAAASTASTNTGPRPLSLHEVGVLYAQRAQGVISDLEFSTAIDGQNGNSLFAALSDVKFDGVGGVAPAMTPAPQWLGQVWQATTYRQQVLPLFGHGDLTGLSFSGFKFTTKPAGGDWAGNKAAVPSNTVVVAPVTGTAARYAIGHDIAREFVDFPVAGFFEGYAAAVTEDYARWADGKVAAAAIAGATALAGDALTTLPGVAGGTIGSAASAIIDGATAIITAGSLPDFALVAPALWKQMSKMPKSNVIGYLNASLGLEEGALNGFVIRPSASVAAGKVLVGCKGAVTVLELPGAPVRIDALDLARGGVDRAAFGYLGVNVNDALGLQLVTAAVS